MTELTEIQFNVLKGMVDANVFFVILPDLLPEDPEPLLQSHKFHLDLLTAFVDNGFAEECTAKFKEAQEELQKERAAAIEAGANLEPLPRGFRAFNLTEMAIRMFSAPKEVN